MEMYRDKSEEYFGNGRPEMLQFLPDPPGRVLEIGCGCGAFAARLKGRYPRSHVTAIEPMREAAEGARERVDELLIGDVESSLTNLADRQFDTIVLNDVLEHLVDPWDILKKLRRHLTPDQGTVVVSLPNVRYFPVFKSYVSGAQWRYESEGVMDRTHLRFFTKKSIEHLFESSGYKVIRLEGINPMALTWKVNLLNRLTGGSFEDLQYMQFACVAKPA